MASRPGLNSYCGASITNNQSDVKSDAMPAASFLLSNSFSRAPSALVAFISSCNSGCWARTGNEKQQNVSKAAKSIARFMYPPSPGEQTQPVGLYRDFSMEL